jgi:hypothetical protein
MPTPRMHGGAALALIPMNVPAFHGLNTQQETALLGPEWATKLRNTVFDTSGRLAARKGWSPVTTTALPDDIKQIAEYYTHNGSKSLVVSTDTAFYRSTNEGATFTDITGDVVSTDGNWQMLNFFDDLYIIQDGKTPARYNTVLTEFDTLTDVNAPQGGVGLSAFGRLWISDNNGHTLAFSSLLDGTDWTSVDDAGVMEFQNVWPGTDVITAIAAFNSSLIVFGRNNILVVSDGSGSELGLDPFTAYVADVLPGVGCIARDSIQLVDGDLWFLSSTGLQSLGRLLNEKNNPLFNLSRNVQDYLTASAAAASDIRSVYSPEERFYLLVLHSPSGGIVFCFDTSGRLQDGSTRCIGVWDGFVPLAIIRTDDGDLVSSVDDLGTGVNTEAVWLDGTWDDGIWADNVWFNLTENVDISTGRLGLYEGQLDNGDAYTLDYESPWMDITDATQKGCVTIPKRIGGVFYLSRQAEIQFKWAFDFSTVFRRATHTFTGGGGGAQWGTAQFGLSKYGGGVSLRNKRVPSSGTGRYIKIGINAVINNTNLSLQSLDIYSKIGRLA